MSNITEDLLFDDSDSFSIAKIDETIARSKRIVQESLAITKNSNSKPKSFHKASSPDSSISINDSISLNLSQNPKKNPFSENSLRKSKDESFKNLLSDNLFLLKDLETQDHARKKEILQLESQLKSYQHPNRLSIEESLKVKKEKIQELTEKLKKHPLYRENSELKEKIKEYQEINTEARILSEILFEKKNKEEIEARYSELYQLHQENSKQLMNEVQKIRERIKSRQAENQKTISFLSNKLEERILDNQLLADQIKSTPRRNSSRECKPEPSSNRTCKDKKLRRYSNPELESEFFEYNKRIQELEAEVKKYKLKYENLKKTLQKNPRRASIEMKKHENLDKSKKNIPKKPATKAPEKNSASKRKTTPH